MNFNKKLMYQERFKRGTRIKLLEMFGEKNMPEGLEGTVEFVDDFPQIHIRWDNGSSLALDPKVDRYQII